MLPVGCHLWRPPQLGKTKRFEPIVLSIEVWFYQNHFEVEKARSCIEMTKREYPSSCIFPDILKFVKNPPKTEKWEPSQITLVKEAYCVQRKKMPLKSMLSFLFYGLNCSKGFKRSIKNHPSIYGPVVDAQVPSHFRQARRMWPHWCTMPPVFPLPQSERNRVS